MEKKKECPECRTKISSWVRSRVLDNYIETVVEMLGTDLKERRKKALDERKGRSFLQLFTVTNSNVFIC